MAGSLHGPESQVADLELVAFGHRLDGELVPPPCRRCDRRTRRRSDLRPAGHVIVVDVGLQDVADGDPAGFGCGQEPTGLALRVDDGCFASGCDEVTVVAQPRRHDHVELHRD